MNSILQKCNGLVVTIVPAGTEVQTISGPATINDTITASDNSTIWMTQSTYEKILFEQSMGNMKFDPKLISTSPTVVNEIIFNAEEWIYKRQTAYPMVVTQSTSESTLGKNFTYQPVIQTLEGIIPLFDGDVIYKLSNEMYTTTVPNVPTQTEINTWPQLKRKPVTGQDIAKYLEKAKAALEYVS